jgi:hypothetical protein
MRTCCVAKLKNARSLSGGPPRLSPEGGLASLASTFPPHLDGRLLPGLAYRPSSLRNGVLALAPHPGVVLVERLSIPLLGGRTVDLPAFARTEQTENRPPFPARPPGCGRMDLDRGGGSCGRGVSEWSVFGSTLDQVRLARLSGAGSGGELELGEKADLPFSCSSLVCLRRLTGSRADYHAQYLLGLTSLATALAVLVW